jgi:hypothetical protein
MDCEKEISVKIENIKSIFQSSKDFCSSPKQLDVYIEQLELTEPEFRSIAYEGASMAIALTDFEKQGSLNTWHTFHTKAQAHSAQIHAGLGWAIAQQNYTTISSIDTLDPILGYRVLDGCGYYDGIFRQRSAIKGQKIPEQINVEMMQGYDQGLGRSIWYISKGNIARLSELLSLFSSTRHAAFWVGIGVACSYVGGCDKDLLKSLITLARDYQKELATGILLAARARVMTNSTTNDIELACSTLCRMSAQEAAVLSVNSEPDSTIKDKAAYALWLTQIEQGLNLSHL